MPGAGRADGVRVRPGCLGGMWKGVCEDVGGGARVCSAWVRGSCVSTNGERGSSVPSGLLLTKEWTQCLKRLVISLSPWWPQKTIYSLSSHLWIGPWSQFCSPDLQDGWSVWRGGPPPEGWQGTGGGDCRMGTAWQAGRGRAGTASDFADGGCISIGQGLPGKGLLPPSSSPSILPCTSSPLHLLPHPACLPGNAACSLE